MNKPVKKILLFTLVGLFLIVFFIPFVYWVMNPHLTRMQLFLEFWWIYIIVIALIGGMDLLVRKED